MGLKTGGPVSIHTSHCTRVKSHLTLPKRVGPIGRWWRVTVHQHIKGNLLTLQICAPLEKGYGCWTMRKDIRYWKNVKKKKKKKKKAFRECRHLHVFDLDVWPWPYFKIKKAYFIRCHLLYCAFVLGMISVNVIVCEMWPIIHFLWPLTFTCDRQ